MEYSFKSWEKRRRHLAPDADRILPLIAAASASGMNRKQLGHAIKLERDVLDDLLAGLEQAGLLSVANEAGSLVYRTGIWRGQPESNGWSHDSDLRPRKKPE